MSSSTIMIFDTPQVLNVVLPDSYATGEAALSNPPSVYNNFKLIKGLTNDINVFVRDIDRKKSDVTTVNLSIALIDNDVNLPILTKTLTIVDASNSLMRFTVTAADLVSLPCKSLQWMIVNTRRADGAVVPLYSDLNYSAFGIATIIDGPFPVVSDNIFTMVPNDFLCRDRVFYSKSLAGSIQSGYPGTVSTVFVTVNNFVGVITVQGAIFDVPLYDSDWSTLASISSIAPMPEQVQPIVVAADQKWYRITIACGSEAFVLPPFGHVPVESNVDLYIAFNTTVSQIVFQPR